MTQVPASSVAMAVRTAGYRRAPGIVPHTRDLIKFLPPRFGCCYRVNTPHQHTAPPSFDDWCFSRGLQYRILTQALSTPEMSLFTRSSVKTFLRFCLVFVKGNDKHVGSNSANYVPPPAPFAALPKKSGARGREGRRNETCWYGPGGRRLAWPAVQGRQHTLDHGRHSGEGGSARGIGMLSTAVCAATSVDRETVVAFTCRPAGCMHMHMHAGLQVICMLVYKSRRLGCVLAPANQQPWRYAAVGPAC